MSTSLTLYECLQQVSLEKYHGKFADRGILDVGGLLSLTMQDYPTLGISSMVDRQNLFYLIQTIKTMQPHSQNRQLCSTTKNNGLVQLEDLAGKGKDKKSGAKRPRQATENSPVAVKIKMKTEEKTPGSTKPSSLSRSTVCVNVAGFYNYGVPSNRPRPSPGKRHPSASDLGPSRIQVCVRKRPLSQAEIHSNEEDVVTVTSSNTIELTAPKIAVDLTKYTQKYQFVFDEAFHEGCSNKEIYKRTAQPLIETIFNRGKATCFAYGCTGSGKTFTMLGNEEVQGIYILAASEIFSILHNGTHGDGLGLWISFYEIYCGQLFDLLNDRERLHAREDANHQVCIAGLTEQHVHNVEELMEIIEYGGGVRSTGATGVNADSSRSHAILQLEVKVVNTEEHIGRFSFIDLAGCERAADVTDTDKQTHVEGAEINQSLLALKECIRALDLDSRHTPFRQSKLTQVLKDSFVGNCQTCMIANISPNKSCSENTLNTLRYADRVKELKKDTPVTSSAVPHPQTVPATTPESDQLLATNKTNSSSRVQLQALKVANVSSQQQSSPRKLNTPNTDDGPARSKTSSATTTLSPRTREFASLRRGQAYNSGNSPSGSSTAKKRLVVGSNMLRPQTSPNVATVKQHLVGNRVQNRPRTLKHKTDNGSETNSLKSFEIPGKEPSVVQDAHDENNNCADILIVSASKSAIHDTLSELAQPGHCVKQDLREIPNMQRTLHADKPLNGISPPSRSNRYSNGIKTRLAKLFKGSPPVEEPKVIESQPIQEKNQVPNLVPTSSGIQLPNREMTQFPAAASEQGESCLNLVKEQFIAAHHSQLAMVTGLCHKEMVLLKQIYSGQKDFKDYLEQLEDILTQKAACIELLQEKLSKFLAQ